MFCFWGDFLSHHLSTERCQSAAAFPHVFPPWVCGDSAFASVCSHLDLLLAVR